MDVVYVELEQHGSVRLAMRDELPEPVPAHPGDLSVKREREGVQQAGLPGAGGAGDHEQVERGQVDDLFVPEGGEPLELEAYADAPRASSWSSSNSLATSGSSSAPCRSR